MISLAVISVLRNTSQDFYLGGPGDLSKGPVVAKTKTGICIHLCVIITFLV